MALTDSGVFITWDPLRPLKHFVCAACGRHPAAHKCGACGFAAYCSADCQREGWAEHRPMCALGYKGYIKRLEQFTQEVGRLQHEAAGHTQVIACYERALQAARAMGDAEGER